MRVQDTGKNMTVQLHFQKSVRIRSYFGPNEGKYGPEYSEYDNFYAVRVVILVILAALLAAYEHFASKMKIKWK